MWREIGGKPTTLQGYGITDGVNSAEAGGHLTASVSGHTLSVGVASGHTIPADSKIALWDRICSLFDVDADGNVYVTGNRGFSTSGGDGRAIGVDGGTIDLCASNGGWAMGIRTVHNDRTTSFDHWVCGAYGGGDNINYTYYGGTYNSPAMVILPNKMVGIGRTDPWYTLDVNGTIRAATGIWSNGYVSAKGQDTTSDARYKRDVAALPAQAALSVLMRLRPSTWAWKDDGRRGAGFVAQEVMGVLPEAVREVGGGEDRHLALNYQMLHAYEVCLLQTHETELERLRGRVKQLENEIKR